MSQAAQKLERIRRLAKDMGTRLESVENLAISIPRAARLIDVQARTLRKALRSDGVPLIRIQGAERIDVIDFVEFLERRKSREAQGKPKRDGTWKTLSATDRAALTRSK